MVEGTSRIKTKLTFVLTTSAKQKMVDCTEETWKPWNHLKLVQLNHIISQGALKRTQTTGQPVQANFVVRPKQTEPATVCVMLFTVITNRKINASRVVLSMER